jgi:hypothetical protein
MGVVVASGVHGPFGLWIDKKYWSLLITVVAVERRSRIALKLK